MSPNPLANRETELADQERGLRLREKYLERDAHKRAKEILNSDPAFRAIIRDHKQKAIMQSRAVLLGKLLECIAPCFRRFGHDPRDMRPVFDPVDYIVFNGLTVDRLVQDITFVEVKCGTSRLTPAQKSIRDAVEKGRVGWQQWTIGDPRIPIEQQLGSGERKRLPNSRPDGNRPYRIVDLPPDR